MGWQSSVKITEKDARKLLMNRLFSMDAHRVAELLNLEFSDVSYKLYLTSDYTNDPAFPNYPDRAYAFEE